MMETKTPTDIALILEPAQVKGELDIIRGQEDAFSLAESTGTRIPFLFTLLVVLPIAAAAIYNFFIVADRYSSTASFIVREMKADSGLSSLVGGGGIGRSDDNSYAVVDFMKSRDAVEQMNKNGLLNEAFGADGIDLFSKFPSIFTGNTKEELYQHFQHYVDVEFKPSTGISTLTVQAFSPVEAQKVTEAMLSTAEQLVNKLNDRAFSDSIASAQTMVKNATDRLLKAQQDMTDFRNREKLIDVNASIGAANKLLASTMSEITDLDVKISQIMAATPNNPGLKPLIIKRDALQKSLAAQKSLIVGASGNTLSGKIGDYERLSLDREIAEKNLLSAVALVNSAQQQAEKGKLYIERIVDPNVPDKRSFPFPMKNILIVAAISLCIFWIVRSLTGLMLEEN